jgi:hypothetical protein
LATDEITIVIYKFNFKEIKNLLTLLTETTSNCRMSPAVKVLSQLFSASSRIALALDRDTYPELVMVLNVGNEEKLDFLISTLISPVCSARICACSIVPVTSRVTEPFTPVFMGLLPESTIKLMVLVKSAVNWRAIMKTSSVEVGATVNCILLPEIL